MFIYQRINRSIVASGVLAGLCVATPSPVRAEDGTPPAERVVMEAIYDLTGSAFVFACSPEGEPLPVEEGEPVVLEGRLYERITVLFDGAGGLHYTLNTMPVDLRGVGQWSGEEFRVSEEDRGTANNRLAGGSGSYRQVLKLVGRSTHRRFWLVSAGQYVIGSDGQVHRTRDRLTMACKA